ncbi:Ig-like domain-containing protein, partial [Peptostreptococcus canis]|uniref:Ig-like domain-containing protein n=1 Tax=Peptostreptococcus canis TaxID=1159213 RepID=UPI001AE76975
TEYVENSADNGGVYSGGTITWTRENLGNGETFEVTFKVKVKESAGGEKLTNEALVKAGNNNLKTNPTNNPVPETPPTTPKKEVFKGSETTNIDGKEVNPGEILTYKVTYKNTTGKEQKVVIEDKIPEFTEYVNNSADNGGVYSNGTITWTKASLGNGETFEVTFKVKVKESAGGENLKNEALVKAGKNDLKTNPTNNPVPETPPTPPKKEVFKGTETTSIDGKEVNPGDILTYKITYKNTTGKEQKVVIEDKIPEFTEYVNNSADNGGVYSNGTITWTKENLGNGETFEVTFKVKVKESASGENLKNEALVKAGKNDLKTNPTNNPVPETPPTKPKKEVFKGSTTTNIDGKEVKFGEILTYKITYKNITGKVQKVVIEDKIPEFTEYIDNSADNGGVYSGGKITWTKASLGNGETYEVRFKVKVKESAGGENLKNEALVKAGKNDLKTNPTNNPVPETPPTKPKKEVFKGSTTTNIDGKEVKSGEILTYKITYKNITGKVQKVVIEDKIPEFTEYVDNSADNGGVYSGGTITWTKENLGNGETYEVTFKVKVKESASGENLKNEALVKAGNNNLKTNPTNNPVPETPPTRPKKEVFKGDTTTNIDGKEVNPGEILTYKITYKNTTRKEQDVVITDKIPTHTAYIENSADNSGV